MCYGQGDRIQLYRAVDFNERSDIYYWRKFRATLKSMEGKWFAETADDAAEWGRRFYQWNQEPFYVVQIDVPEFVAEQMFRRSNLDNIGSARWASEGVLLDLINSTNSGIIELPAIPIS